VLENKSLIGTSGSGVGKVSGGGGEGRRGEEG
jgi:hypothetical protein